MKVPAHEYAATVGFYRDVLGFEELSSPEETPRFAFGDKVLWIDRVAGIYPPLTHCERYDNDK